MTTTAPALRLVESLPTGLLIGGEWRDAADGRTFGVEDPATGAELLRVASAGAADGIAALDAACAAADSWARTPARRRGEILRRAWELLQARADDVALLMTLEMGKPLAESLGEVAYGGEFLRWFAEEAVRIPGRFTPHPDGAGDVVVSQRPVGPSLLITPWNFPLAMATRKIAPALAAGCTVVVKPAAQTPLTTLLLAQLLREAGVPAGVVNVIPSDRARAATEQVIADPRLRKLSFTGSTEVGRVLLRQAAAGVLRTSMELGGNAPFLVFDDADLDAAVDGAMHAKFRNIGQACTAANRVLVQHSVADAFVARLAERVRALRVGPGVDRASTIGPLIDESAVEGCLALIADAVDRGAHVVVGGSRPARAGHFLEPTLLVDVPRDARIVREEIFGPVLAVSTFCDEETAIRLANDTEYGLVAYAYTRDLDRTRRLIDRLDTGMMGINTGAVSNAAAPFGGVKQSGLGREGGAEGIHEYLAPKYTLLAGGR